jgi:cGMP-dependent protein kinase
MAPEVIMGEGYSFFIDFWSIAVCIYEFICGGVPFGESFDDPMEIYSSIINNELVFPAFVKDLNFKGLLKAMLKKKFSTRLCNFLNIKSHPWFEEVDWVG